MKNNVWKITPLSKLMRLNNDSFIIDNFKEYKRVRVQVDAKGIILRDIVKGIEIKIKNQQICKTGNFLVAEIDAKVGGYGIVPKELDGAIVSSHYFLYTINKNALDKYFLGFYIKTQNFFKQINAQGSTNYASIRPNDVLDYFIQLPKIKTQKKVVKYLQKINSYIEDIIVLKKKNIEKYELYWKSFLYKSYLELFNKYKKEKLNDISTIIRGKSPIYSYNTDTYIINQKCIRWNDIDPYHVKEVDITWRNNLNEKYTIKPNDIFVNSTGEGTIGRASRVIPDIIGYTFDSHIMLVRPNINKMDSGFISYFITSPLGQQIIERIKGATTTKQTELGVKKLRDFNICMPPIDIQKDLVKYLDILKKEISFIIKIENDGISRMQNFWLQILHKTLSH